MPPERESQRRPLTIRALCKVFAGRRVLDDLSLQVPPGTYTCVMGPSGSGKSTLLRLIGGHEHATSGSISFGDDDVTHLPAERRPTHTIFQDLALFQRLSVCENVAFAGRVAGDSVSQRTRRANELLELVGLDPSLHGARLPNTLSGGERQRVALARALYRPPECLLLDEPMSALDRHLRADLREQLHTLQTSTNITFVHVTHDTEEAMHLADDLVVLVDGRIAARGTPSALYGRPPTLEVARLLGALTTLPASQPAWIRPEHLRPRADDLGRLRVTERERVFVAGQWILTLVAEGVTLSVRTDAPPETTTSIDWGDAHVLTFAPSTESQ